MICLEISIDGKKRIYPLNALQTDIYEDACQCPTRTIVIVELHHMFFDGLFIAMAHVPGAFHPHFCAWNPVLETFVPKMTLFPEQTPVY